VTGQHPAVLRFPFRYRSRSSRPASAAQTPFNRIDSMRYRSLGTSGLEVSVVGLGCNNFGRRLDVNGTRAVIDAAIDEGITLFDTAETYGGRGA
jgi:hypothetical protein